MMVETIDVMASWVRHWLSRKKYVKTTVMIPPPISTTHSMRGRR